MKFRETKVFLIDKPKGLTSHDVVDRIRKITGVRKVGHAGTLDPFATGLLLVAVGRENTKKLASLVKLDKEYEATIELGKISTTGDPEGEIARIRDEGLGVSKRRIQGILRKFLGKQKQVPPMFSAKKIGGKKLYELARKGKEIKRKAVEIEIKELEILNYKWPLLRIRALVSSGAYMRVLAQDIGKKLGTGGYLTELRRTKIGKFSIKDAISLGDSLLSLF